MSYPVLTILLLAGIARRRITYVTTQPGVIVVRCAIGLSINSQHLSWDTIPDMNRVSRRLWQSEWLHVAMKLVSVAKIIQLGTA